MFRGARNGTRGSCVIPVRWNSLDALFSGTATDSEVPDECMAISETIDGVVRTIADPAFSDVQACAKTLQGSWDVVSIDDDAGEVVAETVPVPAAVPATTAP
jgi:hypothetical protein